MASTVEVPFTVFADHARQIKLGIKFIQTSKSAKRLIPAVIDNSSSNRHALEEIRHFQDVEDYPELQHSNANYMSLIAGFEEFLRQSLIAAIQARANSAKSFEDLGKQVHDLHMRATGLLLYNKANPPQQLKTLDYFQLCKNIGTCFPGTPAFAINAEAISAHGSQLDLNHYIDVLHKFGYNISLDRLGADINLQRYFSVSRTRDAAKHLLALFTEIIKQRKRVAHTGSSSDVTLPILEAHMDYLLLLAQAIKDCL